MKNPRIPQKYYIFLSKNLNMMVLILVMIILAILVFFLYNNFYLTLSEAKEVSTLQKKVISEKLSKEKFYEVLKNIELKSGGTTAVATPHVATTTPMVTSTATTTIATPTSSPATSTKK